MYVYYWSRQVGITEIFRDHFSSNEEDKWLIKYLPERHGRYLDVGTGHPLRGSNTYLLYRRGWAGMTIDPIFGMHLLHRLYRRRDKKVLGVVGLTPGSVTLYEYSPTEYSTISESRNKELISAGAMYFRKYYVDCVDVSALECESDPLKPFLVSLDIEGMDLPVLDSLLKRGAKPRVVCVENSNVETEIQSLLYHHDYRLMHSSGLNSIFVNNLYLEKK